MPKGLKRVVWALIPAHSKFAVRSSRLILRELTLRVSGGNAIKAPASASVFSFPYLATQRLPSQGGMEKAAVRCPTKFLWEQGRAISLCDLDILRKTALMNPDAFLPQIGFASSILVLMAAKSGTLSRKTIWNTPMRNMVFTLGSMRSKASLEPWQIN